MGILDSLENSPAFKGALGQLEAAVVPVVLSEVLGNGSQGGLNAIVAKLQQAGFGDQVKSWIGNGQNLPITAEQLQQVLGSERQAAGAGAVQYSGRPASPKCWRSSFLWLWISASPTASCRIRPKGAKRGFRRRRREPAGGRPKLSKSSFIALKNLQNPQICHVLM